MPITGFIGITASLNPLRIWASFSLQLQKLGVKFKGCERTLPDVQTNNIVSSHALNDQIPLLGVFGFAMHVFDLITMLKIMFHKHLNTGCALTNLRHDIHYLQKCHLRKTLFINDFDAFVSLWSNQELTSLPCGLREHGVWELLLGVRCRDNKVMKWHIYFVPKRQAISLDYHEIAITQPPPLGRYSETTNAVF